MNAETIRDAIHQLEKAVRIIESDERYGPDPQFSVDEAVRILQGCS